LAQTIEINILKGSFILAKWALKNLPIRALVYQGTVTQMGFILCGFAQASSRKEQVHLKLLQTNTLK